MRKSLIKSVEDSPVKGFERYSKGSIVMCNSCAAPLYKLDGPIALGDKCGRMVDRFKPVTVNDLNDLADREDIDAGVRATLSGWDQAKRAAHVAKIYEPRTGEPMACPICLSAWPQMLSVEKNETYDRAYTVELVTIPPKGQTPIPLRGKQIGTHKGWVH